jgi:acyl carrier protein
VSQPATPPLTDLLAARLDVPPALFGDDVGRDTLAAWTSLAHIDLVLGIEEAYGVRFTTGEIAEATTVGALRRILNERGVIA